MTLPAGPDASLAAGEPGTQLPADPADPAELAVPADPADPAELAVLADPAVPGDPAVPDELSADSTVPADPSDQAPTAGRFAHPAGLLISAALGGGLTYSFATSSRAAVIGLAVAQGVLILSWVLTSGLPGRLGAIAIGAGVAAAADIVITHRHNQVGSLAGVLGLAVTGVFGLQVLRGRRRERVVESVSNQALLLVAVAAFAILLELRHQIDGRAMTIAMLLCVTAALVAGHLVDWVWAPLRFDPAVRRGLLAVLVSLMAGALVTMVRLRHSVEFTAQRALLLGAAVALVTALLAVGAAFIASEENAAGEENAGGQQNLASQETGSQETDSRETGSQENAVARGGRLARSVRLVAMSAFVFGLSAPIAYLLCLALRG